MIMEKIYYLKENIITITDLKEKNIIMMANQNIKENIYMIENGMEKDMIKMVI